MSTAISNILNPSRMKKNKFDFMQQVHEKSHFPCLLSAAKVALLAEDARKIL